MRILDLNVEFDNYISLEGIPQEVCHQKQTWYICILSTLGKFTGSNSSVMFVLIKIHLSNNQIFFKGWRNKATVVMNFRWPLIVWTWLSYTIARNSPPATTPTSHPEKKRRKKRKRLVWVRSVWSVYWKHGRRWCSFKAILQIILTLLDLVSVSACN